MLHLEGNNAPVDAERDAVPTHLIGDVPDDLWGGTFVRNGPNPRTGWSPHLYAGDGMLHAIAFGDDGRTITYRNRWVRTPLWAESSFARDGIDHTRTTANTHVVEHAGRLLALEEGGFPHEVTPALDTVGAFTFGGALTTPMTAHPKTCPTTGELHFFGTQVARPPWLTLHRATAGGELDASRVVDLDGPTMIHDFAITATHVVVFVSPWTFDARAVPPWRWVDDAPARIAVLPRSLDAPPRWFETSPAHLSHAANAWDDGDRRIVLTGTRLADATSLPIAHRWDIDLHRGTVSERPLDDAASEYPRVPDHETGRPSAHTWTTSFVYEAEPDHHEVHRYDLSTGDRTTHVLPRGHTCGEPVPAGDDGRLLLTFAHSRGTGTSYVLVLDAERVEPVCEIHLPVRVPGGFHGSWLRQRGPDQR